MILKVFNLYFGGNVAKLKHKHSLTPRLNENNKKYSLHVFLRPKHPIYRVFLPIFHQSFRLERHCS